MKSYPNILLVAGTGRNVGKTVSACNLIQNLSEKHRTVGVKISPHFHELESNLKYLHKSEEMVIVEEQNITQKDSSRMLQAGAQKVFYVLAKNENLADAFKLIVKSIHPEQPVVIESGGLYEILEPGLLVFVTGEKPQKEIRIRKDTNVVKVQSSEIQNFEWNSIQFKTENLPDMLDYNDALQLIISSAKLMPVEKVELQNSLKRVLATDVVHDMDMPPFNKSAMDGYACRQSDLNNELEVVETINAGKLREKSIGENQCYKIMTGAVVPQEADFVFKIEDAEMSESGKVVCKNPSSHNNICYRGEDIKKGQIVLNNSTLLTPRHLPVLAGAGISSPYVYSQPAITVFATGTELVEPAEQPKSFQIRNSNSSQLLAQISEIGIKANYGGIIKDEKEQLKQKLQAALNSNDLVICTGGVSVGEFDLIPEILSSLGYEILVRSTGIKPGKPLSFARKEGKYCFGLSGNPVSSFVQFELYVKPFLYAIMGHNFEQKILTFRLGKEFHRKSADRINFVPANVNEKMEVTPVEFHGSAHINALSGASYLLEVPRGVKTINKGEEVNVRPI